MEITALKLAYNWRPAKHAARAVHHRLLERRNLSEAELLGDVIDLDDGHRYTASANSASVRLK
jgi:hypothetical protein